MSWLSGLKPSTSESDLRENRRKKLEQERLDRLHRSQQREAQKRILLAAQIAQAEADQACKDLLNIDPDLFEEKDSVTIPESEILDVLNEADLLTADITMADFETENGVDGEKALDKLGSIKLEFDKEDIEMWFSELEGQLEVIEVKAQWTKRTALQRFLPLEIKSEAKSLFKLTKTQAGDDIYKKIKDELIQLFGAKPEDAYNRAKNRVMTGKPSQLGKSLIEDICACSPKLKCPCCAKIVWGMYREALPVVVRNHIAEMEFTSATYKNVLKKSDQVFDSNSSNQPVRGPATVAAVSNQADQEVAAVRSARGGRGGGRGGNRGGRSQRGAANGSGTYQAPQTQSTTNSTTPAPAAGAGQAQNKGPRHATAKGSNDKLCKIHYRWGENATFCAAPWKCPMKDIYKTPQ